MRKLVGYRAFRLLFGPALRIDMIMPVMVLWCVYEADWVHHPRFLSQSAHP
jgi:hypothetical protein